MSARLTEPTVADVALGRLATLGYSVTHGPEIASGELLTERFIGKGS
jgi:predicted methyltransferase MtxX (methanogen marker protein 4)